MRDAVAREEWIEALVTSYVWGQGRTAYGLIGWRESSMSLVSPTAWPKRPKLWEAKVRWPRTASSEGQ